MSSGTSADQRLINKPSLLMDLWDTRQCALDQERRIEFLSYYLWEFGGRAYPNEEAELEWREATWRLQKLKPSFVLDAACNRDALIRRLDQLTSAAVPQSTSALRMIVAVDGAPEFARYCFRNLKSDCEPPQQPVEKKDRDFYEIVFHALRTYQAQFVDQQAAKDQTPVRARLFQDACVAVFKAGDNESDETVASRAVSAAFYVKRRLEGHNEEKRHGWRWRIHPRITIGTSWGDAISCLPVTHRSEIRLSPEIWEAIPKNLYEILKAAGVGFNGPRSTATSRSAARQLIQKRVKAGVAGSSV